MSWNDSENCFGWGFWYRRCLITSHWSAPACTVNRKSTEEEFASPGERTFKGHFIWPQRKADSKAIWLLNLLQCTGLNFHCFAARDLYFPSSAAPHLQNYWLKIDWLKCYHTECLHQVQGKRERLGFFLLKMPSTSFYCTLYLFYFHCCMKLLKSYSAALCGGLMQAVWVSTQEGSCYLWRLTKYFIHGAEWMFVSSKSGPSPPGMCTRNMYRTCMERLKD